LATTATAGEGAIATAALPTDAIGATDTAGDTTAAGVAATADDVAATGDGAAAGVANALEATAAAGSAALGSAVAPLAPARGGPERRGAVGRGAPAGIEFPVAFAFALVGAALVALVGGTLAAAALAASALTTPPEPGTGMLVVVPSVTPMTFLATGAPGALDTAGEPRAEAGILVAAAAGAALTSGRVLATGAAGASVTAVCTAGGLDGPAPGGAEAESVPA
jgi:hypothetical protein